MSFRLFARSRVYAARHTTAHPRVHRVVSAAVPTVAGAALVLAATGSSMAPAPDARAQELVQATAVASRGTAAVTQGSVDAALTLRSVERASRNAARATGSANPTAADAAARVTAARAAVRRAAATRAAAQAAAAKAAARRWVMPLRGYRVTSGFGSRWGRLHTGNDFAVPVGTRLGAMSSGTVTFAAYAGGYGYKVEIRYWDGTVSYYGHMSKILVRVGTKVAPGQPVGLSGNTGRSTGPHLHLEVHPGGGKPVNPLPWLKAHGIKV